MKYERRIVDAEKGIVQVTTEDERFYSKVVDGKTIWIPSVTWICNYLPKGVNFYKWLASKGWDESQALMEAGGERGTKVHNAVAMLLRGETVSYNTIVDDRELTTEEYYGVMTFVAWFEKYHPTVERFETTLFSLNNKYAGTLDLQCLIEDKKRKVVERWIIDNKTSNDIWPSHKIQVSAYKHASDVKIDKIGILQLGYKRNKEGYKFTEIEDDFPLFKAAYTIWESECRGISPMQKDYPLNLSLNIKGE